MMLFENAEFQIEIEGVTYMAPYDLDFTQLTPEDVLCAQTLMGAQTPIDATLAFLFVNTQRHIPQMTDDYYPAFYEALKPMFGGDGSMIVFRDDGDGGVREPAPQPEPEPSLSEEVTV